MKSNYTIKTELHKDKSLVMVEMTYKDEFSDDKYSLMGWVKDGMIDFNVIKNNKQNLSESTFYYGDIEEKSVFLERFSRRVNDYDFIEDFKKHHLNDFSNELNEHISKVGGSMISNGQLFEGYKSKMRKMAGIITPNKNIR
jgi:hypothetical protein